MKSTTRALVALGASAALAGVLTVSPTSTTAVRYQVAPQAAADGIGHSAVIRNDGDLGILACKSWGVSACRSDSPRGWIYKGENTKSKFGWADADGVLNPNGREIRVWNGTHWISYGRPSEQKIGGCGGCTKATKYLR